MFHMNRSDRLVGEMPTRAQIAGEQLDVFERFVSLFDIEDAIVVELGGRIDPVVITEHSVREWWAVDPRNPDVGREGPVITIAAEAAQFEREPDSVDLVFSSNAFQHIRELESNVRRLCTLLRRGGYLYANFGPVWSAPDGSHVENLVVAGRRYDFWHDALLPSWSHLIYDEEELLQLLLPLHGRRLATALVRYVFHSTWINRLFFDDYVEIFARLPLETMFLEGCSDFGYDYSPPVSQSALGQRLDASCLLGHIRQRYGEHRRNLTSRDIELVLRKP